MAIYKHYISSTKTRGPCVRRPSCSPSFPAAAPGGGGAGRRRDHAGPLFLRAARRSFLFSLRNHPHCSWRSLRSARSFSRRSSADARPVCTRGRELVGWELRKGERWSLIFRTISSSSLKPAPLHRLQSAGGCAPSPPSLHQMYPSAQ